MKEVTKKILAIGLGAIIAGSIVFGVMSGIHKRALEDIRDNTNRQLYELKVQRDEMEARADSVNAILAVYKAKNDSLDRIDHRHRVEIDRLKMELKDVLNDMWDSYLEDNGLFAYDYLRGRYYSEDTLRYLFSGDQVVEIATDIIKGDYLDSLLRLEQDGTAVLKSKILNFENMVNILEEQNQEILSENMDLSTQLEAWIRKQGLTEEENAWLRKKLNTWRAAGLSGAAVGVLLLILL